MSSNDAWDGPVSDSHQNLINARATKKVSDGDGTDTVGTIETGAIGVAKSTAKPKTTKSSAPKKIISEGNELAARWKKLAGLK